MNKIFSLKGVFCLLVAVASLNIISCAKEVITHMELFYNESRGLSEVTLDSLKTFTNKFGCYVANYPESRQDKLFEPTVSNIRNAAALHGCKLVEVNIGITFEDEFLEDTTIYF